MLFIQTFLKLLLSDTATDRPKIVIYAHLTEHEMSSSIGSGGKTGNEWTSKFYYYNYDDPDGPQKIGDADNEKLKEAIRSKKERNENIVRIWAYKCPLSSWQRTQALLYHEFIVLKTNKRRWWSIEKNSEGITVQIAKSPEYVRDHCRQTQRNTPISEVESGKGRHKTEDLLEWLCDRNELNKGYSWLFENCQHFAQRVFNAFAKKTRCNLA